MPMTCRSSSTTGTALMPPVMSASAMSLNEAGVARWRAGSLRRDCPRAALRGPGADHDDGADDRQRYGELLTPVVTGEEGEPGNVQHERRLVRPARRSLAPNRLYTGKSRGE